MLHEFQCEFNSLFSNYIHYIISLYLVKLSKKCNDTSSKLILKHWVFNHFARLAPLMYTFLSWNAIQLDLEYSVDKKQIKHNTLMRYAKICSSQPNLLVTSDIW